MTTDPQGTVDPLDFDAVVEADADPGPKVTFYVPTEVTTTAGGHAAATLTAQLKTAQKGLEEAGLITADAEAALAGARELTTDSPYWRRQSRGLVVFAAPGFHRAVRLPIDVAESVTVGDRFHVRPLVPVLESAGRAYVLAVSKKSVRLYEATRNAIERLPQGRIPETFEDVVDELPEAQLQSRPSGGGRAAFHGHGGSDETDTMLTRKFLRAVGEAVARELGTARSQPLVLAAVAEHLPVFRDVCPYPVIHDEAIAGNPDHTDPDELRSAAWRLLRARATQQEAEEAERAQTQAHNGRGSFDLAEIAASAVEGRVETLYLPRDPQRLSAPDASALADAAILDTVRAGGTVRTWGEWERSADAVAVFRY